MSSSHLSMSFLVCMVVTGSSVAQKAASAVPTDVRPAIFQSSAGSAQPVVASISLSNTQLSGSSIHMATTEEVDGMEKTLEQYVVAFESLSLPQVKEIWPELDSKHAKGFKEVFSALKGMPAPRLGLQCAIPRVSSDTANVECTETITYTVSKGKTKEAGPAKVSIQMKSTAQHWVLQDMKGAG